MNWLQAPESVRRFSPHQIVQHGVALAAWVTLTVTASLSSMGFGWGGKAHVLAGVPAVGFLVYHLVFLAGTGIRRDVPAQNIAFLPWGEEWPVLFGRSAPGSGTGKYAPPEKADYLGILLWALLAAVTGLALRWPSALGVPSLSGYAWLKTVHAGAGAALGVHVLVAHARFRWLDAPPAFRKAILTGMVPLEYAEGRPGWVSDLAADGVLVPAPSDPIAEEQRESRAVRELLDRGNRFARGGDYESACEAFSEALRLLPEYSQARFNLAVALIRKGSTAEAREQLLVFIETDPFNPMAEKAREMLAGIEHPPGDTR
jgi:hypothetical protein